MVKGREQIESGWNLENSYANLPALLFSQLEPDPAPSPELIILNHPLAESLGLDIRALESKEGVAILAGNRLPEGSVPIAQAYAGHQFGFFTMLGDGRALLLGEQITPEGKRFDIQFKGSGKTPYSRGGDGRGALGPMLREYIISEAMYELGIPTTRSLAVVSTGEPVIRETKLPGAILTRVASSHLRVGTFQYALAWGNDDELRALADYALQRHFLGADEAKGLDNVKDIDNPYLYLLQEVIKRQANLIARWQLVGFIHGVMNTDNMTISGETIDYGPCAFMDTYDPATVFSSIDAEGRYAYGNQPDIGAWNLARFAEALLPLLHTNEEEAMEIANEALSDFVPIFEANWLEGMKGKLGIFNDDPEDKPLIESLLNMMEEHHTDYTNTFIALTFDRLKDINFSDTEEFTHWHQQWKERLAKQEESDTLSHQLMRNSNPALIPRNHRVEEALEAAVEEGDYSVMERLLDVLSNPYAHSPAQADYATPPPPSDCPYQTFCGT